MQEFVGEEREQMRDIFSKSCNGRCEEGVGSLLLNCVKYSFLRRHGSVKVFEKIEIKVFGIHLT